MCNRVTNHFKKPSLPAPVANGTITHGRGSRIAGCCPLLIPIYFYFLIVLKIVILFLK